MSVLSVWYDTSSQLFWYKLVFMIELLFAETLFVLKLKRRPYFVLRVIFSVALLLRFSLLVPVLDYSAWYNALMFFVMFAASVLAIKFCFDESWKSIVFCAIAGYTVQHVAFTLYSILGIVFDFATSDNVYVSDGALSIFANASTFTAFVGCHFFVYFVLYIFFVQFFIIDYQSFTYNLLDCHTRIKRIIRILKNNLNIFAETTLIF